MVVSILSAIAAPSIKQDVQKVPFLPSQPRRATSRLSTGKAAHCLLRPEERLACWAGGVYTSVREQYKKGRPAFAKLLLRFGEAQETLACQP